MNQGLPIDCWSVPAPLLFHPLKHHLRYLCHFVQNSSTEAFYQALPRIGASQMDLYCGALSPEAIGLEIRAQLEAQSALTEMDFLKYLGRPTGFQVLTLTDTSVWTLRLGNEPGLYVHIHPGRYAQHCTRVKAGALKTALIMLRHHTSPGAGTQQVNQLRNSIGLSPIKDAAESLGIIRIWELLLSSSGSRDTF